MPEIEFEHDDFEYSADREIELDQQCQKLLYHFYQYLQIKGFSAQRSSELAFAVDYYLRDYLLDACARNVMKPEQNLVKSFAGNWFITHTVDPEIELLKNHCDGIILFYRFLHEQHFISKEELDMIEKECSDIEYYRLRIESFYNIKEDGYALWNRECPAKP